MRRCPLRNGRTALWRPGSEVLGLELRLDPEAPIRELRFYDPVHGQPLRSLREEQAARREEQAAREAAEARLQQLETELQALRRGRRGSGEEPDSRGYGR